MNANIKGMQKYWKHKNMNGALIANNGYSLSDSECRAYLKWCVDNGYETLHDAPDWFEVKDKLK